MNTSHTSFEDKLIFQIYAKISISAVLSVNKQFVLISELIIDNTHNSNELIDHTQLIIEDLGMH